MGVDYRCISLPNTNTFVGNWIFISISDARGTERIDLSLVLSSLRRNTEDKEVRRHGGIVGFLLMIALVFLLLAQFSLVLRTPC